MNKLSTADIFHLQLGNVNDSVDLSAINITQLKRGIKDTVYNFSAITVMKPQMSAEVKQHLLELDESQVM